MESQHRRGHIDLDRGGLSRTIRPSAVGTADTTCTITHGDSSRKLAGTPSQKFHCFLPMPPPASLISLLSTRLLAEECHGQLRNTQNPSLDAVCFSNYCECDDKTGRCIIMEPAAKKDNDDGEEKKNTNYNALLKPNCSSKLNLLFIRRLIPSFYDGYQSVSWTDSATWLLDVMVGSSTCLQHLGRR